jgi:hypothetical protein
MEALFESDIDTPTFALGEVAALVQLSAPKVASLVAGQHIPLSIEQNPGRGQPRLFSLRDVVMLAVAGALASATTPPRFLEIPSRAAAQRLSEIEADVAAGRPLRPTKLLLHVENRGRPDERVRVTIARGGVEFERLPTAVVVLDVDRLIIGLLAAVRQQGDGAAAAPQAASGDAAGGADTTEVAHG